MSNLGDTEDNKSVPRGQDYFQAYEGRQLLTLFILLRELSIK